MADNTLLNPGAGGDTIRTLDRTGTGTPKTEVVQLDVGGPDPNAESLVTGGKQLRAKSIPIVWPSDEVPLPISWADAQFDDDGVLIVNPAAPGADIATGQLQLQILSAVNGAPLSPGAPVTAAVGVASGVVLAQNLIRKGLVITNTSTSGQTISLHLSGGTAVSLSGITLWPGDVWEMGRYTYTTNAISAIASAASANLGIQEFS